MYKLLLKSGAYVVNYDLEGGLGSPRYLDMGDKFFKYYSKLLEPKSKPILLGEGLASLFALNYAAKNPDKVAGIVLVEPLDIYDWAQLSQDNARRFKQEWRDSNGAEIPLESVRELSQRNFEALELAKLPILIVRAGDCFNLNANFKNVLKLNSFESSKIADFCKGSSTRE